jgi:hypothetical protein
MHINLLKNSAIYSRRFVVKPLISSAIGFGEQLSLCFQPIGLCVARQRKSASAFGDEVGSKTNGFVRRLCDPRGLKRH